MSELNKLFLRRLEEMWDEEKLYQFVSDQVNWMYEDLQSPDEIKASFLNTFHDELASIANAMVSPLDAYQKQARTFLLEKFQNMPMFELVKYCTLGLNEEAGEVAGKIKKSIRDADGEIDEGRIDAIVKEMGDVLWYLAIMAYALGLPLSHIAQKNIEKLSDRMNRGKIQGEGDER